MNEDLKDILSNLGEEVDQEKLLKYLRGQLSADELHEVEKHLLDDGFEAEAVEGLQNIEDKNQIPELVKQLNRDLRKKTSRKRRRLLRPEAKVEPWLLLTVVLLLLLAIVAFMAIRQMHK